jgi:hypothetical protein
MNGSANVTIDVNTHYIDPGIVIKDNHDVITNWTYGGTFYTRFPTGFADTLGTFTIVYNVVDNSGNTATVTRTVEVVDVQGPDITLKGDPSINICRWSKYTDAGYNLKDNFWANSDITVDKEGSFIQNNGQLEGLYSLRYKATDKSGNVAYSEWRRILVLNPEQCNTTAILEGNSLDKSISIFPNPGSGLFVVSTDLQTNSTMVITITNMLGQQVGTLQGNALQGNTVQVDLRGKAAGVYTLTIAIGNERVTRRVLLTD